MTFNLRHAWTEGARFPALPGRAAMRLATCAPCETLRVQHGDGDDPTDRIYIRRRAKEDERVTAEEPPCVSPSVKFQAPW